jgi:hypothetical protein
MATTERDWFIRIPAELYGRIREIAEVEDRSIASATRTLLRAALTERVAK